MPVELFRGQSPGILHVTGSGKVTPVQRARAEPDAVAVPGQHVYTVAGFAGGNEDGSVVRSRVQQSTCLQCP